LCCKKLFKLTTAGGVEFWVATIATSYLLVAAEYRAAFSNWSIQTVWVDSLLAGMTIGCCVSYTLLRFLKKNPAKDPILKSVILSAIALVIAIALIDVPMIFLGPNVALHYFLIGVIFNAVRFLFLGSGIGYLYKKLYGSAAGFTRLSLGCEEVSPWEELSAEVLPAATVEALAQAADLNELSMMNDHLCVRPCCSIKAG
jgi:general stress protein CsbA